MAQDGGQAEPGKEKAEPVGMTALTAPEPQDGGKEKAPAAGDPKGGKVEPVDVQDLAATEAEGGRKEESMEEKAPAVGKPEGEKAKSMVDGKGPAAAKAQGGGKDEPAKGKTPGGSKMKSGGKAEPMEEKAPAAEEAEGQKAKPTKGTALAVAQAQDGGKEESAKEKLTVAAKEKGPAAAKAQDGEKKAAKAEKTSADTKPVKEKAPAPVKAQDGDNKVATAEKAPDAKKPKDRGKVEPAKEKPAAPPKEKPAAPPKEKPAAPPKEKPAAPPKEKPAAPPKEKRQKKPQMQKSLKIEEKAPAAAKAQDGGKAAAKAEKTPAAKKPQDGNDVPPPPAPFAHRVVTLRSDSVSSQFNLSSKEILGGGKFGEVHTCTEKQTGLKLAAKVIRKQGAKDKEMVLLEIDVMNQLNHRNLIQLYDAIETPREIILFMEFVEGGELFERIIDDDYQLTEVDCMVFVRQICEGIRFMHHMCVLHLDLKPENILCAAATGHMVKIIDFGLARRYNPQEKLKVNFGTPEFLSPEVVNYEQVSYSTDMWSMGVITYMLLSGLSPFLGDNDTETLNNVLAANWYFDEETFESVSDEAKDFVSNLIIKEKSARMSAGQCLQHPWLNNLAEKAKRCNRRLKSQVLLKKYVMRRRGKKNFIGVCAANRFKKITSSGSLTALGV
ncbi:PREDICTED: myosin light chain kinase 2, skeletal/cardiac muscle [Chaetura pelagica]|uniref:myosin light chain kinase 2, skeletal/cardiac muscle n=1 Tax=Chaetura pelagica TaxID=8897 RepID=UPI000523E38B|nr:PREDICTED: myosin light chain kinase 2, skeletal/cardiac muscle [Chaetura pelagica]